MAANRAKSERKACETSSFLYAYCVFFWFLDKKNSYIFNYLIITTL